MFRLLMILALGAALVSRPALAADTDIKRLTAFFEDVAFGAEYTAKGSSVVQKWESPLRINVSAMEGKLIDKAGGGKELKLQNATPAAANIDIIRKHLKTLIQVTGIKAESPKDVGKAPNFFIKFVPRLAMHAPFLVKGASPDLLKRLAAPGVCYFLTAAKEGRIVWATIVVNNALEPAAMTACLLEEMTQALGLPNDSDLVQPSVFNNRSQPVQLGRSDLIVIRTLYDAKLKAGMGKLEAMAIAGSVIAELDRKLTK
jgi:hypothetical protein